MELRGSLSRKQGLSIIPSQINLTPRINTHFLTSIPVLFSHLRTCLPGSLFSVRLPIKILKALLLSFTQATVPVHFKHKFSHLTVLGEQKKS